MVPQITKRNNPFCVGRNFCLISFPLILMMPAIFVLYWFTVKDLGYGLYEIPVQDLTLSPETAYGQGANIFMHILPSGYASNRFLHARQACAIESVARHNPESLVYGLITKKLYSTCNYAFRRQPMWCAILSYGNFRLRYVDLDAFAFDTPYAQKLSNYTEEYQHNHRDVLRYLTLYKFGGTFMDSNSITLDSLAPLGTNFLGVRSARFLGTNVLNLSLKGVGHDIADLCLRQLEENRHPYPSLKVYLYELCNATKLDDLHKCQGFKVFPPQTFYPLRASEWPKYFEPKHHDYIMDSVKNSTVAYIWQLHTVPSRNKREKSAYNKLAEMHCPKVYQAVKSCL